MDVLVVAVWVQLIVTLNLSTAVAATGVTHVIAVIAECFSAELVSACVQRSVCVFYAVVHVIPLLLIVVAQIRAAYIVAAVGPLVTVMRMRLQ